MVLAREFPLHSQKSTRSRAANHWRTLIVVFAIALKALSAPSIYGQTQQPFVVAVQTASTQNGTVTFVRDDTTGVLTLVANSTVIFSHPCTLNIIEPKDRFLFGPCGNGLSMYTFDGST